MSLLETAVRVISYVVVVRLLRRTPLGRLPRTWRFVAPFILLYVADVVSGAFGTANGGPPRWAPVAVEFGIALVIAVIVDWSLSRSTRASDNR